MSSCSGKLMKVLSFFLWPVCLEGEEQFYYCKSAVKVTFERVAADLSKTKRMSCKLRVGGRLCSLILRVALCLLWQLSQK